MKTAMPIQRALWLHYPDDSVAVARSTEYLWGRDMLVCACCGEGRNQSPAVSATLGLVRLLGPAKRLEGGPARSIAPSTWRTMPLYIRAGAILPFRAREAIYGRALIGTGPNLQSGQALTVSSSSTRDDGVHLQFSRRRVRKDTVRMVRPLPRANCGRA